MTNPATPTSPTPPTPSTPAYAYCPTDLHILELVPRSAPLRSAPWRCPSCLRAFFPAELTPAARNLWNPTLRSFGNSPAAQIIISQAEAEAREQVRRGSHG